MNTTIHPGSRKGQTIVLFCGALVAICLVAALAVDVGHLLTSRARLQNGADSASLAALLEIWEQRGSAGGEHDARYYAQQEAEAIVQLNYPEAGIQVTFGVWDDGQFTPVDETVAAHAVKIKVCRNQSAPGGPDETFFAGLMGMGRVNQAASAVARYQPKGLIPFSIYEPYAGSPGDVMTLYDDTLVTPGVFGLLDFDGGENSAADQKDWTENGYEGSFNIDPETGYLVVEGNTGWVGSLNSAIDGHITEGDPVVACVYRTVSGTGANTIFEIVGFVQIVITDRGTVHEQGETKKYIEAMILGKYIVGSGQTVGSMRDFMRLQLVQ